MSFNIKEFARRLAEGKTVEHPLKETGKFDGFSGWVENYQMMRVHTKGDFPSRLFLEKYPTEPDYWFKWRKKNLSAITKDAMNDAIIDARRMFSQSNFAVAWNDSVREYMEAENFDGLPFIPFIYSTVFRQQFEDANAILVPVITDIPETENESVAFELKVVLSPAIVTHNKEIVSWLSDETHTQADGSSGRVWYVISSEAFYRLIEVESGRVKWNKQYHHSARKPIFQVLGGIPDLRQEGIVYKSFFEGFVAPGNEAIKGFSNWQMNDAQNAHAIRQEYADQCTNVGHNKEKCDEGYITNIDGDKETCGVCGGLGYALSNKPTSVKLIIPGEDTDVAVKKGEDLVKFIRPPVESLEYQFKTWREFRDDAKRAVNLLEIMEAQSAVAKFVDREGKYAQIEAIADFFFDITLPGAIWIVTEMLNPGKGKEFVSQITKPTNYRIKTEDELLLELQTARTNGEPITVIAALVEEYLIKRFGSDIKKSARLKWLFVLDPLQAYTLAEKGELRLAGIATSKQIARSTYSDSILRGMEIDNKDIFNKGYAAISKEFEKQLEALITTNKIDFNPITEPKKEDNEA